ncbi:MAG: hypothetical protein K6E29_06690 [Cyanobacteria bacterium RUI128]|nr:hypothetical protein [Cyanobacteria bacterium RUI128]
MKVNFLANLPAFKSVREDRNTVSQLRQNNDYSLNEPNQRRINEAIDNLAKQRGEENIRFLLDVGKNLKYQTVIPKVERPVKNDWNAKLKHAAEESLAISNPILREKYQPEINRVFDEKQPTKDDEYLAKGKNRLVKAVKGTQYHDDIERNLEYFITSTETPIEQKKYILKRLNYMMSSKYEINPQLKDKKPQVLSEIVNDITVNTPDSKIPNIKAINQKTHGMCAAISIARKSIAYEDKPNYVDAILSELDSSDNVMIYDRQNLGKGKRIPVKKIYVDYDYAQKRGYRIVDASTLQWMNIGGMYGVQNENMHDFNAFDKNNFDAFHDAFFTKSIPDEKLAHKQAFFQVLTKAKADIGSVKSDEIRSDIESTKNRDERHLNIEKLKKDNQYIRKAIEDIAPTAIKQSKEMMFCDMMKLAQPLSANIEKLPKELRRYAFIPNEEPSQKIKKVEAYLTDSYGKLINRDKLKANSEYIVTTLEEINTLDNKLNKNNSPARKIAKARKMYEAEAIYRASVVVGMMEDDNKDDMLIKYNVPDRETRISDGYATAIKKIEKNNDKKLLNHFAPYFNTTPDDKEKIVEGLNAVKNMVDYLLTDELDELYSALGYGNRRALMINEIDGASDSIKHGDKAELKRTATCLHSKEDKLTVLKELDKLKKNLTDKPEDQKAYVEAFNKMGYKDQVNAFVDIFGIFTNNVLGPDSEQRDFYISNFKAVNGLKEDASQDDILNAVQSIGNRFNTLSQSIANAGAMLEVEDENGEPYFTTNAASIILKKMENEGKLIPVSTMKKLQDRFTKIDKIRSSDEFSSRQGKISDPTLYKLSKEEKAGVKQIHGKLNAMYADVTRNLEYQYREIKEPLEEIARYVGTNEGSYWVIADGTSGLFTPQQIKIFEQLTDRPHYAVKDIDEAVDKIKNGTHSGISGSSVFHDRQGGHAMYIADVVKDEKTGKDILYHDNTWGASEHENTWVDSNGLTRTDYSDRRGGELGYITNKDWLNGNFVENLTHKKGHVSPDDVDSKVYKKINPTHANDYDFTIMHDIILEGTTTEYKDIAGAIKDEIFIPETAYIGKLEKYAKGMTKEEIQKRIFRNKSIGETYRKQYDRIIERITDSTFNKGITTEEEYNSLPDNDIVKVAFEKAAVRGSYADASMYKELGAAKTMDDVRKIKAKQRKIALDNFYYSFNKNDAVSNPFLYVAYDHGLDFSNAILNALKNHDIKIPLDDAAKIIKNVATLEKDEQKEWNGSVRNSIDLFLKRADKQFDEQIPVSEKSQEAKKEFLENLEKVYVDNLYFTKEDLKNSSDKANGIKKWIDDKFAPQSDDDFVRIYRTLQDMPKEEFDKLTRDIDDKYLGIKDVKGYELLQKVKAANEGAESLLRNTLFYDEYSETLDISKTRPSYKFKKLEKNARGAFYVGARTFDDLYRTMYFSLMSLEYPNAFNKYKDANYRKYGAFPAYPKIDLTNDPVLNNKIETAGKIVDDTFGTIAMQKNCIYDIKLIHQLDDYRKMIPEGKPLTKAEKAVLDNMIGKFITANMSDPDLEDALNDAYDAMDIPEGATIADYNADIDTMVETIEMIEHVNGIKDFEESNDAHSKALRNYFNVLLNTNIPPKYHRTMRNDLENWINLEVKARRNNNAIDSNREAMEVQYKISMFSNKGADKKSQIEDYVEITNAAFNAKNMKDDLKTSPEALEKELQALNEKADKFVTKYIQPDAQITVRANMKDMINRTINGGQKEKINPEDLEFAKAKFQADFKKYHLTSHPLEVIDNFLLLSAKDAKPEAQQQTYKHYLETELNLAKYVSIQDYLMEAVEMGNASNVQDYFDDYYVDPYNQDQKISMNSDASIDYMIRNLILEDNTETAKMFVEKLGLGDRIVKIEMKTIEGVDAKGKIDEIAGLLRKSNKLTNVVKQEYEDLLQNIDEMEDPAELDKAVAKTKRNIKKRTKNTEDKASVKTLLNALDDGVNFIKAKPEVTKSVIMQHRMNDAFSEVNDKVTEEIKEIQSYINIVNLIYKFLDELSLPEYSKGYRDQQKAKKDHMTLVEYNNKVLRQLAVETPGLETRDKEI